MILIPILGLAMFLKVKALIWLLHRKWPFEIKVTESFELSSAPTKRTLSFLTYDQCLKALVLKLLLHEAHLLMISPVQLCNGICVFPQLLWGFSPDSSHSPKTCTLTWLESLNQQSLWACVCVCVMWWTGDPSRLSNKSNRVFFAFPPLRVETSWWSRQETLSMSADTHTLLG